MSTNHRPDISQLADLMNLVSGLRFVANAYAQHVNQIALVMQTGDELLRRLEARIAEMQKEMPR